MEDELKAPHDLSEATEEDLMNAVAARWEELKSYVEDARRRIDVHQHHVDDLSGCIFQRVHEFERYSQTVYRLLRARGTNRSEV